MLTLLLVLLRPMAAPQQDSGHSMACPSAQTLSWEVQQDLIPLAVTSTGHFAGL